MLAYVIFGASYGLAAAVQPGQLQAFLLSRAVATGWRRTLPAVFAPVLSDIPAIVLVLVVLTRVPPLFLNVLRVVGGLFLLYLAAGAIRTARAGDQARALPPVPAHRTFLQAVVVNLLNPNPYLGWALVLGPWLLQAWARSAAAGVGLLVAFYLTLFGVTALLVALFAMAGSLGPRVSRGLLVVSAVALAVFGAWQLLAGMRYIIAR